MTTTGTGPCTTEANVSQPTAPPGVAAYGLCVSYGDTRALDDASVTVTGPGVTALLGVNGAGKSTFFKALLGLVRLDAGTLSLLGLPAEQARAQRLVAYVGQSAEVDWDFPIRVRDVVLMGRQRPGGTLTGWRPRRADHGAVTRALDDVGLTDLADRQIGALSGGQRKRVFIARAIAQGARLVLLDEPFAGLDRGAEAGLVTLVQNLAAQGACVLLATHDLASVPEFCDEAILWQRRVVAQGAPRSVLTPDALASAFGVATTPREAA